MLELIDLTQQRGPQTLLGGLNLALHPGELVWIRGANGSGKTSLLRICAGLTRPSAGSVRWKGQPLDELDAQATAHAVWVGHRNGFNEQLSPFQTLRLECGLRGLSPSEDEVINVLYASGLQGKCDRPIKTLSQGQKRRVALARLLLGHSKGALWLLDEPFAGLDAQGSAWLHAQIRQHTAEGGLVMVTAHDQERFQSDQQKTVWLGACTAGAQT